MADTNAPQPGVYRKDKQVRIANTPADAVGLVFQGFSRVGDEPTEGGPTYDALKEQARDLGVPIKGTKEELAKAVSAAQADQAS